MLHTDRSDEGKVSDGGGSLLDLWDGEDFGPEAGQCVRVADLHHLDLGEDAVVKRQLLPLERNEHLVAQVDRQQIGKLLHRLDLPIKVFDLVGERTRITLVLEEGGDGLLALAHILQVLLSVTLFLFQVFDGGLASVAFGDSFVDGLKIENFTLGPVVNVDVGVLQFASDFVHASLHLGVVWVCQYELSHVHISVVLKVHVLVTSSRLVQILIALITLELSLHHLGSLALDLVEEWFHSLKEHLELSDLGCVGFLFH